MSGALATLLFSCNSLDLPPRNIIQEESVFTSEAGITAYMARIYSEMPVEDHRFCIDGFAGFKNYPTTYNYTGECMLPVQDFIWGNPDGGLFQAWRYGEVRNINFFLESLEKHKDAFNEEDVNHWMGEAYFMRAYTYFAMVKRYGGVPIIKDVQNFPEQSIEELKVPRNKEQEVYDFIAEDLDKAIAMLPEKELAQGRVNKYVAYALKSRAMLYAGSIAQFGTAQLDGLVGIPSGEAKKYYQASYDASKALEGKYSLYLKNAANKAENYANLFLDSDSPENIYCKYYKFPEYCHSYDALGIPFQMRGANGYGGRQNPTLEFLQMFDGADGSHDWLKMGTDENPTRFTHRVDIFANAEPRLRGSVIFPGDVFKGEVIDVQKGIFESYPNGTKHESADFGAMYKDKAIQGRSGMGNTETTSTGFHVRKYLDPNRPQGDVLLWRETQHFVDFRYAETLLNRAEAAFALGMKDDALACINQIRDRAGAKLYTATQINLKNIQKERRMELAFENHTWWDLRRWRLADTEISNTRYHALAPYYVYDEGKYIYLVQGVGPQYTFDVKVNYCQIPGDQISKNELLVQNPGY